MVKGKTTNGEIKTTNGENKNNKWWKHCCRRPCFSGRGGGVLLRLAGGGFSVRCVAACCSIQTPLISPWAASWRQFRVLGMLLLGRNKKPPRLGTPGLWNLTPVLLGKYEAAVLDWIIKIMLPAAAAYLPNPCSKSARAFSTASPRRS